jgi:hypothetical protein
MQHKVLYSVVCAGLIVCLCVFAAGQEHQVEHGGVHMEKQREAHAAPLGHDEAHLDDVGAGRCVAVTA